jgi:hypothetical protein
MWRGPGRRTVAGMRLSYANVTASLALFVALGGTGYAASTLPRDSVGSKQIRAGAVTSSDVRNGSLRGADFAAGALPPGPRGAQGERGPQGERGSQGPAGQPDASRFYDKAGSDARFATGDAKVYARSAVSAVGGADGLPEDVTLVDAPGLGKLIGRCTSGFKGVHSSNSGAWFKAERHGAILGGNTVAENDVALDADDHVSIALSNVGAMHADVWLSTIGPDCIWQVSAIATKPQA